jgi:hypothetical protein
MSFLSLHYCFTSCFNVRSDSLISRFLILPAATLTGGLPHTRDERKRERATFFFFLIASIFRTFHERPRRIYTVAV